MSILFYKISGEYVNFINSGLETPIIVTNVIDKYETKITPTVKADYNWKSLDDNNANLWQKIESVKYILKLE